jgi:predicted aldo/keto reductase-like oxidoreductase
MRLRNFGTRSGLKVARASIGAMRLPRDIDEAVGLIRHAIDSGMRYIDTSRGYGESEWLVGQALKDGYRKKVILSSKWSAWITKIQPTDVPTADCVRRRLEESMRRLGVDYMDFYQVWNVQNREDYNAAVAKGGPVDALRRAKAEGLIGHIGFTTHDSVENLLQYLDEADWCEVLLTSYNLLNRKYAPVIAAAHRKGIGTIVMNPIGGGRMAEASPVLLKLARAVGAESVPDLAVRYILSNPDIDTLLCGMSKTADVDATVRSAIRRAFTAPEMKKINRFIEGLSREHVGFCTGCKYCMPCPAGIDIPSVMSLIYDDRFWGFREGATARYRNMRGPRGEACVKCRKCEKVCTQHLKIVREMAYAAETYADPATK